MDFCIVVKTKYVQPKKCKLTVKKVCAVLAYKIPANCTYVHMRRSDIIKVSAEAIRPCWRYNRTLKNLIPT